MGDNNSRNEKQNERLGNRREKIKKVYIDKKYNNLLAVRMDAIREV